VPDPQALVGMGRVLGEDLFDPPNVKGWKGGSSWISTQSMLARRQVLSQICAGALGSVHDRTTRTTPGAGAGPSAATPGAALATGTGDAMAATATTHAAAGPILDHGRYLELARHDADGAVRALTLALLPLPPVRAPAAHLSFTQLLTALLTDPVYNLK